MTDGKHVPEGFEPDCLLRLARMILPEIVNMYSGAIHGDDAAGIWDIEFPSVSYAASWAEGVTATDRLRVKFRDPVTRLFGPVVVQADMGPDKFSVISDHSVVMETGLPEDEARRIADAHTGWRIANDGPRPLYV